MASSGDGAQTPGQDAGAELARLIDLATPYAVRAAVTLRLPELVRDGTSALGALAAAADADEAALARLLRHLVAIGLFAEPAPGVYALTPLSTELLSEDVAWQRKWLDLDGPGAKMDLAYSGMLHSVRTGRSAYDAVHGTPFWTDYQRDEPLRLFFGGIMAAHAWQTGPAVATGYDWADARRVIDVGGGIGALLSHVLRENPALSGAVLDLPPVEPEATETLREAGLAERAEFLPGSFFDALPTGFDVYLVSRVLTDWNDEDATKILLRCADAARPGARVVIVEVLAGAEHARNNSSFDLQSLTLLGGQERSVEDFHTLAGHAGLEVLSTRTGPGGLVFVDCAPSG
ncbi:SAM-dependent methyltransferase [Amycolatopsis antarctica]|uniref:SAM-dependent methyltransferase n=1 Tax=Amycolatopsis antarctica TaxID=1854586 RepID=A0A263D1D8_9PSEU|nr:methyltransferase [Amycolatopsis antarctica]OZM72260.1 SAM-dependent methyltransferase [Amycolatopsis antarctica]